MCSYRNIATILCLVGASCAPARHRPQPASIPVPLSTEEFERAIAQTNEHGIGDAQALMGFCYAHPSYPDGLAEAYPLARRYPRTLHEVVLRGLAIVGGESSTSIRHRTRGNAALLLLEIGDQRIVGTLVQMLRGNKEDQDIAIEALTARGQITDPRLIDRLVDNVVSTCRTDLDRCESSAGTLAESADSLMVEKLRRARRRIPWLYRWAIEFDSFVQKAKLAAQLYESAPVDLNALASLQRPCPETQDPRFDHASNRLIAEGLWAPEDWTEARELLGGLREAPDAWSFQPITFSAHILQSAREVVPVLRQATERGVSDVDSWHARDSREMRSLDEDPETRGVVEPEPPDPESRANAGIMLAGIGDPWIRQRVHEWLFGSDPAQQEIAIRILPSFGLLTDDRVIDRLLELAGDTAYPLDGGRGHPRYPLLMYGIVSDTAITRAEVRVKASSNDAERAKRQRLVDLMKRMQATPPKPPKPGPFDYVGGHDR